jgi:hypothetical protein
VGRVRCAQGKYFLNTHSLGHLLSVDAVLWDVRCVLDVLNRHSLGHLLKADTVLSIVPRAMKGSVLLMGHLLMADTALWDVRCVLEGIIF